MGLPALSDGDPAAEAATAIEALADWARRTRVTIAIFRIMPAPPWENREIAVTGPGPDGGWMRNSYAVETLSDPQEVDAALVARASAKGWVEHTRFS